MPFLLQGGTELRYAYSYRYSTVRDGALEIAYSPFRNSQANLPPVPWAKIEIGAGGLRGA